MKTLTVQKDGSLRVDEAPIPTINENQALVKMLACGVCNGTDAKLIHHKFKGFTDADYPLMLGHEAVGRVIEIGANVKSYSVGDIVLLPFTERIGSLNTAWGGFSEYGVVNDITAYIESGKGPGTPDFPETAFAQQIVPSSIDPIDAVMIITFREVLCSIRKFGIDSNDSVAVFGCGPVGLTFIALLRQLGVKPIIALDIVQEKLEQALALGADHALLNDGNITERIRAICPGGLKYALDAVGVSDVINQAMPLIADHGIIGCYGISPNMDMHLDWSKAPYNWTLQFQQFPAKYDEAFAHNQVIAWMQSGVLKARDYISDIVPFSDVLGIFEKLERRGIAGKAVVVFNE